MFPAPPLRAPFTLSQHFSKTGWKAKNLATALLEESGVATIGGPDFGILGEGYIRLSYANSEENIERAIERIRDVSGEVVLLNGCFSKK